MAAADTKGEKPSSEVERASKPPSAHLAATRKVSSAKIPAAAAADQTDRMQTVDPQEILETMRAAYDPQARPPSGPPAPPPHLRNPSGPPPPPPFPSPPLAPPPPLPALSATPAESSAPELAEVAAAAARSLEGRTFAAPAQDGAVPPRRSSAHVPVGGAAATTAGSDVRPLAAYELVSRSPRFADLVALTEHIVGPAAIVRSESWALAPKVAAVAAELKLAREEADTRFGNVLDVLSTGGVGAAERALACALWAHAVAEAPKKQPDNEKRIADLLWLAAHTSFDATSLLDRALGDEAAETWRAIAEHVRRTERGQGLGGRAEAVIGCAALAASGSPRARALSVDLAREITDPVLLRVLATSDDATPDEVRLEGEMLPAPRGPVATVLLAVTGILLVMHASRLLARVALAYRVPAEVSLSETGVRVKTKTELLGRTVREREHVVLRTGLVRVVREVRFPRAAFYAGLLALALGSYVGVRTLADGVRSASPSLLVVGLLAIALGVGLDFVLGTVIPGARGRCRISFVPRAGSTLCIGDVDLRRANEALQRSLGASGGTSVGARR